MERRFMMERKFMVVARCADGIASIYENGTNVFSYEEAEEIKNKAHADMYDQVEIIEIEPDCIYRNSQGNLIIITDLVKDVFKLAEKNFKKYPNRSYLSDEKRIEVKKAVNKVIIKWGLNPTNMLLGDILYLESMYKHKQSSLMN